MLTIRASLEVLLILLFIGLISFTLIKWDSLRYPLSSCGLPFNIWMLSYGILILVNRFVFLVVALKTRNFLIISVAACVFFCLINPLIILFTASGVVLFVMHCLQGFLCGDLIDSAILVACLTFALANSVFAVLQSIRIFKSMVSLKQRFLRSTMMDVHIRQLLNGLNDSMSFTHEELSRLPAFRATGSFVSAECAICHEKIGLEELLRNLPGCTHTFHQYCIDNWLRQNPTCPLCRNNVRISFI